MIDDDKGEQINELNYQIELLKLQKEQFLDLEVEIKRSALNIDEKNVIVVGLEPSKEKRVLTPDDLVDSVPVFSSTRDVSTASEKEVKRSLYINDEHHENSLESSIEDDNVKVENVNLKPLTSQDTDKLERFNKI